MAGGANAWMGRYTNPSKKDFMKWMTSQKNQFNPIIGTLTNQMGLLKPENSEIVKQYQQIMGRIPGAEQVSAAYKGKGAEFVNQLKGLNFGDGVAGGVGTSTYSSWGAATSTGQNVSGTYYYAGGGGSAMAYSSPTGAGQNPVGGYGGGGRGFAYGTNSWSGQAGTANTGGGAGGNNGNGYAGGSGIVIIRFDSTKSDPTTTGSPTLVTSGGYRYVVFTGSGSIGW